jgi:hypothetical protein
MYGLGPLQTRFPNSSGVVPMNKVLGRKAHVASAPAAPIG